MARRVKSHSCYSAAKFCKTSFKIFPCAGIEQLDFISSISNLEKRKMIIGILVQKRIEGGREGESDHKEIIILRMEKAAKAIRIINNHSQTFSCMRAP